MSGDRKIEAVIFDMDGVLTDSEPLINAAALAMFRECKNAGLRVAVVSSAERINVDANLNKIGLPPGTWDAIVTAEDVLHKKPAPDSYLASARKLGLSPEQCVAIEAAVNGVEAAKTAGMRCVAVAQTFPPGLLQAADLVKQKIDEISLDDLFGPNAGVSGNVVVPPLPGPEVPGLIEKTPTQTRPWGFWATLGLGLLVTIADSGTQQGVLIVWTVAKAALGQEATAQSLGNDGLFIGLAKCASIPVTVGWIWLFVRLRKGISVREYLALNPLTWRAAARWCAAFAGLAFLFDGLRILLHRPIVPEVLVQTYETAGFLPLLWLAVVVAAPLGEEALFRGFLFKGILHSRLGRAGAVVLTSLIWAVLHTQYDMFDVVNLFVAGLLLGYARLRTNSIYSAILMHALMNLITTIEVSVVIRLVGPVK